MLLESASRRPIIWSDMPAELAAAAAAPATTGPALAITSPACTADGTGEQGRAAGKGRGTARDTATEQGAAGAMSGKVLLQPACTPHTPPAS